MPVTVDDDLDSLYRLRPEDFTARRKELAAAARKRGDTEGAKVIAAARRPTTAAWVVNLLALTDATVVARLTELHEALRTAHTEMDGHRIRELSTAQRKLVQELSRDGLAAAELRDPTAALRDDVIGTLHAAVADPEVAARLGRLSKAEEWSGFGDFGASSAVVAQTRPGTSSAASRTTPQPSTKKAPRSDVAAVEEARGKRDAAESELKGARAAHGDALAAVAERKDKVATARRRYEKQLETLAAAERDLAAAEAQLDDAQRSADKLQNSLRTAESALTQAQTRLDRLVDS
ncbi:hypothetical protein KL864_00475 [Mycolicibacterium goodii]|nr:hypothetical protein [Mycolicibacterium goodii]